MSSNSLPKQQHQVPLDSSSYGVTGLKLMGAQCVAGMFHHFKSSNFQAFMVMISNRR